MTYVIAEPCIGTKDTACVDACPVDCIHPKKDEPAFAEEEMLYIDPVECIDCGACMPCVRFRRFSRSMICRKSGRLSPNATPSTTGADWLVSCWFDHFKARPIEARFLVFLNTRARTLQTISQRLDLRLS